MSMKQPICTTGLLGYYNVPTPMYSGSAGCRVKGGEAARLGIGYSSNGLTACISIMNIYNFEVSCTNAYHWRYELHCTCTYLGTYPGATS